MRMKATDAAASLIIMTATTACYPPECPLPKGDIPKAGKLAAAVYEAYEENPVHFRKHIAGDQVQAQGKIARIYSDGTVRFRFNDLNRSEGESYICRAERVGL